MDIRLYNDCGEEEFTHHPVKILAPGMMPEAGSETESGLPQDISNDEARTDVSLFIEYSQLYLFDLNTLEKDIIITDNIGRVVIKDKFTDNYSINLSTGVYFVSIILDGEIKTTEKVVIL